MAANPVRMRRLAKPSGAMVMLPLDHGVSSGPLRGFVQLAPALDAAVAGGATCVTVHKGLIPQVAARAADLGVLLHLSASSDLASDPNDKRLVATVEEAVRLGCDGVSIHLNLGSITEARQLEEAGQVARDCAHWGMPLVTMAYVRGPKVKDPFDPIGLAHAARVAAELGADAVKVPYTPKGFRDVVQGCPVPVLVAGGPKRDSPAAFLRDMKAARDAGAKGLSVGRNVVQARDPTATLRQLSALFP